MDITSPRYNHYSVCILLIVGAVIAMIIYMIPSPHSEIVVEVEQEIKVYVESKPEQVQQHQEQQHQEQEIHQKQEMHQEQQYQEQEMYQEQQYQEQEMHQEQQHQEQQHQEQQHQEQQHQEQEMYQESIINQLPTFTSQHYTIIASVLLFIYIFYIVNKNSKQQITVSNTVQNV